MQARWIVFVALSCFLPLLSAQTVQPASTPAAAAAKPDLTGEAVVVERDDTVVRFAKDGSNVRTISITEHILSDAGVRDAGILNIPFAALTQTVTFDYVRVHKPSGEVIETPPGDAQEVPAPVTQAAPMYSDLRMKQLPVKSLSVGDTLEYRVSMKDTHADAPDALWFAMDFTSGVPVKEETLELRVPRDLSALVKSKRVQPAVSDDSGERVYRWKHETASEYPKKQEKDKTAPVEMIQEMYEPDVAMTSFHTWAEMGAWYRGLMKDRAIPDAAIQAKADELTHGLSTNDAKVDALYNYVATQYRYIAVSFGVGRLQPHMAAEVFRNQYGDCKDKHTLLQAMLAAEKIEAEPVLIGSSVRMNEALPIPSQFDHMITLVKLKNHEVWLDSTPEIAPSRMLMAGLRDKLALAVPATGDAQLIRTETALPFPSFVHETIVAKLDTHGVLTAHFDLTLRGDAEVIYREVYHQVPRANWQTLAQRISYNNGFAGDVSAVDASLPEKTTDPFHVSWEYTRKDFGDWENRRFPGMSTWFDSKIAEDATAPKRALALDVTGETEVHVKLTLPEGYTVTVPPNVKRSTAFAEYTSTYALKDRALQMDRTLRYKARELPVSEFGAYREFVKGMSDDSSQMLQLVGAKTKDPLVADGDDSETDALMAEARQKFGAQDLKGARDLLDVVKARNDHRLDLWLLYGILEYISGNQDQAIADYKKELHLNPTNFNTYQKMQTIYLSEQKWPEFEASMREWAKADPQDMRPRAGIADLMLYQEHYKDAVTEFQEALRLSPDNEQLKIDLGNAQIKAGDIDAGKATLHSVMDGSSNAETLNGASYYLADGGLDLAAAEVASTKAVNILEGRVAHANVSEASPQDTIKDVKTVVELAAVWDSRGWIAFKEKKLHEAESYVRSAWMLSPQADIGLHLGEIDETLGKKADALATYRLGIEALPRTPHPQDAYLRKQLSARVAALEQDGVVAKPGLRASQGVSGLAALRTYTVPSPLRGQYASADFLMLMGDNRAEDIRFLKGDDALKKAMPILMATAYRAPLPQNSVAKILRRGILACTTGSKTCLLVLIAPGDYSVLSDPLQRE